MLDREPFLRAIFAAPDDDLPRLVFADWLEEHGDPIWAELIRVQCSPPPDKKQLIEHGRWVARELNAVQQYHGSRPKPPFHMNCVRGFRECSVLAATSDELVSPEDFRSRALNDFPEWYGATRLSVSMGPVVTPEPLVSILTSPVTANVTELDLSGREIDAPAVDGLIDVERRPTINSAMVEFLAGMRECRRLTVLDLRNNDLGNDSLRALAESPYFTRLKTLRLSDGNRFRGRVWQQVLARFGEPVVE